MEKQQRSMRKLMFPLQITLLIAVTFGVGVLFGTQFSSLQAQGNSTELTTEAEEAFRPLFQTYNLIQDQYIDNIEDSVLVDAAINGMVEALDDQYSNYVDAEFFGQIEDNLSGQIEGIGVTIQENEDGVIEVVNVLEGTPAERSGVQNGDIFIRVNGEDVRGLNTAELATIVRGPSGSTVEIAFSRDGEEIELTIERAPIEIPNIETEILEGDIAYIRMASFTSIARDQVNEALAELDPNSTNGLIFDLRDNPGGFLSTATEIAGMFLEEGTILIEEFGDDTTNVFKVDAGEVIQILADGSERIYSDNAAFTDLSVPVVILVNERSASASELVAGAWQDNGTVTIIGETTFGKGTVQLQNTLINGAGLRLTVARWLTPLGNSITDLGVTPDIFIPLSDEEELALNPGEDPQLDAAVEFLLTGEIPEAAVDPAELEAETEE